jgi:hypothetical protein
MVSQSVVEHTKLQGATMSTQWMVCLLKNSSETTHIFTILIYLGQVHKWNANIPYVGPTLFVHVI